MRSVVQIHPPQQVMETSYDKETLERMLLVEKKSYESVGRLFNVTGNAIKKAALKYGIPLSCRRKVNSNEVFNHGGSTVLSFVNKKSDDEFAEIIQHAETWQEIASSLGYKGKTLSSNVKQRISERCDRIGVALNLSHREGVLGKTKGELFKDRKTWQSARGAIRKIAWKTYMDNNPSPSCAVCGYDKHVEVAHIKSVAEFDDSATVKEINSIDNLIGLCPNHHWEYDHGLLKLDNIQQE